MSGNKKPVLTGGKAGLASLLYIGVSWSCMMGWEKKGTVILLQKQESGSAAGPAAVLTAVQVLAPVAVHTALPGTES